MKIKLFTHTDLDGIGCAILGIKTFKKERIDIEYCDYDNINDKVRIYIDNKKYLNFDHTYITDISINKEIADLIENTQPKEFEYGFKLNKDFTLIDHHPTALFLNKYWWCNIKIEVNGEKASGTSLFYQSLVESGYDTMEIYSVDFESVLTFVQEVKRYDTWLWKTKYNDKLAKQLNDLLYILGRDRFIERSSDHWCDINDTENLLLQLEEEKIDRYIKSKNKDLMAYDLDISSYTSENIKTFYKIGVVFAEQYISQLGNVLAIDHPELDFIVIIDSGKTVSYRGIKDNIDLGKIATIFGGGGHPNSAGSPIDQSLIKSYIQEIFKELPY